MTSKIEVWDAAFESGTYRRHHLRVDANIESSFWSEHDRGVTVEVAAQRAGVGRSTAYRWIERRFHQLRDQDASVADVRRQLRLDRRRADAWEIQRLHRKRRTRKADEAALRAAVKKSASRIAAELNPAPTPAQLQKAVRDTRYWELRRQGESNTSASRILGMHRKTGTNIRLAARRSRALLAAKPPSGRYLSLAERLQIADLRHLGCSIRQVARELDRAPSTIKREIDRHTNAHGRYLPRSADEAAAQNRRRPREYKLIADSALRRLVQRKLDLHWSPDEISGWLKVTFPDDHRMRVGHETIYRALLVRGGQGLDKGYCSKLRTGRTQRKSQWSRRPRVGGPVQNMTMIDQRPEEVETKKEIGHWEGDLVLGERCRSAMMTLRERKTQ
ncbi:IS30 family transposase [Rhodococcus sp. IEGM 1307]|uniref:IS30 family transposase n=1 Tax=Rhodococcus sp. IEGM 1307 TaxID=3047091 RepID=UPI0024B7B1AE|nr:IS30 family transposase [Rhodococcus sp. IEGM 1307]MDI9980203.1 IS30 family transposase [Rhodococcus sp. IEGM 1307]